MSLSRDRLHLAVQKSGRLSDSTRDLLRGAGFRIQEGKNSLAARIEKDESVAWIVQAYAHRAPNSCVCLTKAERKRPKACVRVLTFACWLLAAAVDSRTFVLLRYVTKRVGES